MSGGATHITPGMIANMSWIKPPPGQVTDFNTTETIAPVYTGVAITSLVLAIGFLAARFYVKIFVQKKVWLDDASLLIGLAFQCAYTGVVIDKLYPLGAGKHAWNVHIVNAPYFAKYSGHLAIISEPLQMFVSWGFLFFYIQLFWPNKPVRYGSMAAVALIGVVYIIPMVLYPVYSDITSSRDTTIDSYVNIVVGVLNVVTNLIVMVIPVFAIWSLTMTTRRKLGVAGIFATGILATVMSVVGLVYRVNAKGITDVTHEVIPRWTVTTVEINVGIICACLPLMPALINQKAVRSRLGPTKPTYDGSYQRQGSRKLMSNSSQVDRTYMELDEVNDGTHAAKSVGTPDSGIVVKSEFTVTQSHHGGNREFV